MNKKEQYEKIIELVGRGDDGIAHGFALGVGFPDGLTAETFEKIIAKLGLTSQVIESIIKYYGKPDVEKKDTL